MTEYRFLEHATDAIIEAKGRDINDAFLAAAYATVDLTLNRDSVSQKEHHIIEARGEGTDYLLFSWLEEIIFVLITQGFAIKGITIDETSPDILDCDSKGDLYMRATAYGETLDLTKHGFKVEIKAPTFHDMEIVRDAADKTTTMRFLLDL